MKVKSESEVAQSCPTPSDPMDCSLSGSSVHGIFQARVLEWGAIAFSGIPDQNHAKLSRRKELGGETGVLVGLDLPLAGGGTETGVRAPHWGNCLNQRRNV